MILSSSKFYTFDKLYNFITIFFLFKILLFQTATGNFIIAYPKNARPRLRTQYPIPKSVPFPCTNSTQMGVGRSWIRPTSVHRLRPGDIDIIGALGDSLIAGNGALEEYALGTILEHRGVSWCAGKDNNNYYIFDLIC